MYFPRTILQFSMIHSSGTTCDTGVSMFYSQGWIFTLMNLSVFRCLLKTCPLLRAFKHALHSLVHEQQFGLILSKVIGAVTHFPADSSLAAPVGVGSRQAPAVPNAGVWNMHKYLRCQIPNPMFTDLLWFVCRGGAWGLCGGQRPITSGPVQIHPEVVPESCNRLT